MEIGLAFFTKNCLDHTIACLNSIESSHPYHIVVVDDESTDDTPTWVANTKFEFEHFAKAVHKSERKLQDVELIYGLGPTTLGSRWNVAMQYFYDKGLKAGFICNNDILFHPITIDAMVARMEQGLADGESLGMVTAHNVRGSTVPNKLGEVSVPKKPSEAPHPDFSCFMLLVDTWIKVGRFSQDYKPCYFEDNDFHTMMKIHGIEAISTTAAPYYHFGSVTQNQIPGGICTGALFEANRTRYIEKFGALPDKVDIEELRKKFL
jgi:GT2 family glycosyltransferase